MKRILYAVLLSSIFMSSCKKGSSDVDPDLSNDLVGRYVHTYTEKVYDKTFATLKTEWTISKSSSNVINLVHRESETVEGPKSGLYEVMDPFESTLKGIKVKERNKFYTDQKVDWFYDGSAEKSQIVINASLSGNELSVHLKEVSLPDGAVSEGDIKMIKQ